MTKLTFMRARFFRLLFGPVFIGFFIRFFFRRRSRRRSWFWNQGTCFTSVFSGGQFVTCSAFVVHTIRGWWSSTFTLEDNFRRRMWNRQLFDGAWITLHALSHLIQSNFVGSSAENFLKCFALQSTQFEAPSPKHPSCNVYVSKIAL